MEHELKTDSAVFEALAADKKTYELRKDDRNYQEGDTLRLRETRFTGAEMATGSPLEYTGREEIRSVSHVLRGPIFGLAAGWAILSCQRIPHSNPNSHKNRAKPGTIVTPYFSKQPTCAVGGMIRPGAVCGSVIVGGKLCGSHEPCPHKVTKEGGQ